MFLWPKSKWWKFDDVLFVRLLANQNKSCLIVDKLMMVFPKLKKKVMSIEIDYGVNFTHMEDMLVLKFLKHNVEVIGQRDPIFLMQSWSYFSFMLCCMCFVTGFQAFFSFLFCSKGDCWFGFHYIYVFILLLCFNFCVVHCM